ncbi:hypothetical protein FRC18_002867 [Serendipita sp. 400]|nr:hypothetical protein FRC18_002867 [Serendipita sp. 400]
MISPLSLFTALCLAGQTLGHTIFQQVYVNGVSPGHLKGIRYPTYDGPIYDVSTNDIICNGGLNPLVTGLKWFKIYEDGLGSDGRWAVERMIDAKGKVDFKIPTCIPNGDYFMRVELIALHGAGSSKGAQFYMECAQIRISGGGSASPSTVSFPGAYGQSDPGILINIYYPPVTNYQIPGPRPFTCGSTPPASSSSRVSSSTPSSSSSSRSSPVSSPSSSSRASSTTSSGGGAPLYGQCGGQGWTGPTTCAQGTCKVSNQWYSQCLP